MINLDYIRSLRFYFLIIALFPASLLRAQCSVTPSIRDSVISADTISFINTSTGRISSTTYTWTFFMDPLNVSGVPGGTTTLIANTYTVLPVTYTSNGTYLVRLEAMNSPTCPVNTFTMPVSICAHVPSMSYNLYNGNLAVFTTNAAGSGLRKILWRFGNLSRDSVNPVSHRYFNGVYYPTVTISYGANCTFNLNAPLIRVTNNPCPANSAFTYTTGLNGACTFSASVVNATTISCFWNFGDGSTATLKTPVHTYTSSGNYPVRLSNYYLTDSTSCADTSIMNVNITGVFPSLVSGLKESGRKEPVVLNLFPNPSRDGILNLVTDKDLAITEILIYDVVGHEVYKDLSPPQPGTLTLDLGSLTNGIYFIRVHSLQETIQTKFIICK